MLRRFFVVALAAASLAGCVTVPPNGLTAESRQSLFIKNAEVTWSFDDSKNTGNADYAAGKAEMQARLKAAVEREFKTSPAGSKPAVFAIDVKRYSRVGAAMGNIIGGSNMVVADVTVRSADGATLAVYTGVTGMYASNGGLIGAVVQGVTKPDITSIMANGFATALRGRFEAK